MSRRTTLPQARRLTASLVYLVLLMGVNWLLFGTAIPPLGAAGTWFYAGVTTLVLSVALAEPYYTRPADVLLNGVALLLVCVAFPVRLTTGASASSSTILTGKVALAAVALGLITLASVVILTKDATGKAGRMSAAGKDVGARVGGAVVVFSLLYLAAAYAAYAQRGYVLATLFVAWILMVVVRPAEWFLRERERGNKKRDPVGRVVGLSHPGLATVRVLKGTLAPQDLMCLEGLEVPGTVLDVSPHEDGLHALVLFPDGQQPLLGTGVSLVDGHGPENGDRVLAPVEPGSRLSDIRLRLPADVPRIREGHLLRVRIRQVPVTYQVFAASVEAERIGQGVVHRYLVATARKIGAWDDEAKTFKTVPWLPEPGAPISLDTLDTPGFEGGWVGSVPDSRYGVAIDPDLLVTHNAAILGILGSGKTFLAFELIRRVALANKRVIIVDITGQYAKELLSAEEIAADAEAEDVLHGEIAANRDAVGIGKADGGNIHDFRASLRKQIDGFLQGDRQIWVVNPAAYDVTRQDTNAYADRAAIVRLTVVETTRILAEELLEALSGEVTPEARVLLVLEEAHSLVPEWNSISNEADKQASNGIAKAVLQGRKFGLGVLVITQRTANVAKTVLNQSNTIFALRSFDATGMEFLSNYMGSDYSQLLPTLEERTAVIFGRASSCDAPLIVRLNDHDDFMTWMETAGR